MRGAFSPPPPMNSSPKRPASRHGAADRPPEGISGRRKGTRPLSPQQHCGRRLHRPGIPGAAARNPRLSPRNIHKGLRRSPLGTLYLHRRDTRGDPLRTDGLQPAGGRACRAHTGAFGGQRAGVRHRRCGAPRCACSRRTDRRRGVPERITPFTLASP